MPDAECYGPLLHVDATNRQTPHSIDACLHTVLTRKRYPPDCASRLLQESVRAISKVKIMVFMPVMQCIGIILFLIPWVFYCIYTASLGEVNIKIVV